MKRLISVLCVMGLLLSSSALSLAEEDPGQTEPKELRKITINNKEKERLKRLGYSELEIEELTWEEYEREKEIDGQLISIAKKYIKIRRDKDGKIIKEEKSEKEALDAVKKYKEKRKLEHTIGKINKPVVMAASHNTVGEDSESEWWMTVTTTVTKTDTREFKFKHSFQWLTEPFWTLEDAIGITHQEYFTHVDDSEYFRYSYDLYDPWNGCDCYVTTKSITDSVADKNNEYGIAFDVDLQDGDEYNDEEYPAENHRGYMYYYVTLSNTNFESGSAHGHYTHTEGQFTSTAIALTTGDMDISGAIVEAEMTDTSASFSTK